MFCTQCGAYFDDDSSFCTACGAPVNAAGAASTTRMPHAKPAPAPTATATTAMSAYGDSAPTWKKAAPHKEKTPRKGKAPQTEKTARKGGGKVLAAMAVVIVVLIVAVGVTGFFTMQKSRNLEVAYGSEACVRVAPDTVVIPYGESDEPLGHYQATIVPIEVSEEITWENASVEVSGPEGFSIDRLNAPEGTYTLSIEDLDDEGDPYLCPQIEITNGNDTAPQVFLKADPNDRDSARAAAPTEYGFETFPNDAVFSYRGEDGDFNATETWSYVQFSSSDESEEAQNVITALNDDIKAAFDDAMQGAQDWKSSLGSQCILVRQSVTHLSNHVASVREESYSTDWTDSGSVEVRARFYDLTTGKTLRAAEAYGLSDDELADATNDALRTYFDAHPNAEVGNRVDQIAQSIAGSDASYYIADEGLVAIVPCSDLGEHAETTREIVVVASSDATPAGTDVQPTYTEIDWRI